MNKELEAVNELRENLDFEGCLDYINEKRINDIKQALTRLEQIDNASSSEALECLEEIIHEFNEPHYELSGEYSYSNELLKRCENEINTIKATLLKAQENEKVLEIIKEKDVDIFMLRRFNTLEAYNNYAKYKLKAKELIQEEFEILKRYFENGRNKTN